jgi:hypothetical protein
LRQRPEFEPQWLQRVDCLKIFVPWAALRRLAEGRMVADALSGQV